MTQSLVVRSLLPSPAVTLVVALLLVASSAWCLAFAHPRYTRYVKAERHLAKTRVAIVKGSGFDPPKALARAGLNRVLFRSKHYGKPFDVRVEESLGEVRYFIRADQRAGTIDTTLRVGTGPLEEGVKTPRRLNRRRRLPPEVGIGRRDSYEVWNLTE